MTDRNGSATILVKLTKSMVHTHTHTHTHTRTNTRIWIR